MTSHEATTEFQERAKRFVWATYGPRIRANIIAIVSAVAIGVLMVGVMAATEDPRSTVLAMGASASAAVLVRLWPFRRQATRLATELIQDHESREAREWLQTYGSRQPCTRRGMEQWLVENPRAPGRVSILIGLGRLDDAEREVDAWDVSTPEDRFGATLQREMIAVYRGQEPDIARLNAEVDLIRDRRLQAARRQCILGLQAWHAAERREDALAVLARGRRAIGLLDPASRFERMALRLVSFPLIAASAAIIGISIGSMR